MNSHTMNIKRYSQFRLNENDTSELLTQRQTLTQQINDLQKKLLDVNQQILTAQQQTLSQNPQTQLPVQEEVHHSHSGEHHAKSYSVLDFDHFKDGSMMVTYSVPNDKSQQEHELEFDFGDFVNTSIKELNIEDDPSVGYVSGYSKFKEEPEADGDSYHYPGNRNIKSFNGEKWFNSLGRDEAIVAIKHYIDTNHLIK